MDFSIIILSYNTKELLRNCLLSIFEFCKSGTYEILVVDNNSVDGTPTMLQNDFSGRLTVIANKENVGFGAANNQAAGAAKGEILLFLNSDTIIKDDVLPEIFRAFSDNKQLAIASPVLLLPSGKPQRYGYGDFATIKNLFFRHEDEPDLSKSEPFAAEWVSGAAMAVRREKFTELKGFDERFFMYFEDMDLCRRAKNCGYGVSVLPKARITHLGGASEKKYFKKKKTYYRSQNYFFRKHYGRATELLMRSLRWPYRMINSLLAIKK